jgi:hypothetical protein
MDVALDTIIVRIVVYRRESEKRSTVDATVSISMVLSGVLKDRGRSAVNPHPVVDLVISTWSYRAIPDCV